MKIKLSSLYILTIISLYGCNVAKIDSAIPEGFTLADYQDPLIRESLEVDWSNNREIIIDSQSFIVYEASLSSDVQVYREGYSNYQIFHVIYQTATEEFFISKSHDKLSSPTSDPFHGAFDGSTSLFDLESIQRYFIIRPNNTLAIVAIEDLNLPELPKGISPNRKEFNQNSGN